jgi:hypothetical protein
VETSFSVESRRDAWGSSPKTPKNLNRLACSPALVTAQTQEVARGSHQVIAVFDCAVGAALEQHDVRRNTAA